MSRRIAKKDSKKAMGGVSDSLNKFFKADSFLKITKFKKDHTRLEREIKY